ncbi:MAG: type I-C CRISPR-associated endonuclease Cas1c [Planctomycetota bacterium]
MRQLQNTLYITTQGAYVNKEGEALVVSVEHETRLRVPVHTLGGLVCFGRVSCSPFLLHHCAQNNVAISFLSENGQFLARVEGPVSGNVLLRREQYRRADDLQRSAAMARAFVIGKINNGRSVLMRCARDRPDNPNVEALNLAAQRLDGHLNSLKPGLPLDTVRGIEGAAASAYFEAFDALIATQKDEFFFKERSRRPPLDNMNALMSFLYTLLTHDVSGALQAVGLDPAVGFLHRDRPGRAGLALDMMEEFRPFLADRLSLSLVNLKQIRGSGFKKTESGGIWMDDATRKEVLVAYQKRKQEEMIHPFLNEKMSVALLIHTQAKLLSRHLRGDMDGYPPFLWK